MGYIRVNTAGSGLHLHVAREMVMFAVLSVVLLLITGGIWAFLEWRRRCRERRRLLLHPTSHPDAHALEDKDFIP